MTKAIIADNDATCVRQIESLLSVLWPELEVCGQAASGPEALELIDIHAPELAFLEVRLPAVCGMQVARQIVNKCHVVFTTRYDHYAVNAFESGALDYLLKPLNRERLQKAIDRAKRRLCITSDILPPDPDRFATPRAARRTGRKQRFLQWICTHNGRRSKVIAADQVCYFKADHKYTSLVTNDSDALISKSIKTLVDELDPDQFWRIHRSTIVNVARIKAVRPSKTGRKIVLLKDRPEVLTVSRPYLHLFKKM
jgi:DNA-binding LytR/AlgR family response regulator